MKTQILHLESYDDVHSIKDKIDWGQGDRIVLVWPGRGQLLNDKLDLVLIKRHCQGANTKLALVSRSWKIQSYAKELNIPVFRSLRQAQNVAWEYTTPEDPPKEFPKPTPKDYKQLREAVHPLKKPTFLDLHSFRIASFVIGILSVLFVLVMLLPGAEIIFTPQTEFQELPLTITANLDVEEYNLSGTIPAQEITIVVEGRDTLGATGEISIPKRAATGEVVFTNLTDQLITIPAGTIIRTLDADPIRFATTEEIYITPEAGATATAPVGALNPGASGNLPANRLVVLEGNLALSLLVNNPTPTIGGSEQISAAPTSDDYDILTNLLLASLWKTALDEAQVSLSPDDIILETVPGTIKILEQTFSPEEPQPSTELSLLLRVEFTLTVVYWDQMKEMSNTILDVTLPDNYTARPDSLIVTALGEPVFNEDQTIVWDIKASREIFTLKNQDTAVQKIIGMNPIKAQNYLQELLSLDTPPIIHIKPDWWPWMPFLNFRIRMIDQG